MSLAASVNTTIPTSLRAIAAEIGAEGDPVRVAYASRIVQDAASALEVQARRIALLERLAYSDEATGLLNRRGLIGALSGSIARAALAAEPMAVLTIAIDGLTDLPARIGRRDADEVARAIADALRRTLPAPARLARTEPGEFVALIPGATLHEARARGERLALLIGRVAEQLPGLVARTHAIPVWPDDRPADVLRRMGEAETLPA